MAQKSAVVLAGGLGTRMKSSRHKVLHEVCGRSMIDHILSQLARLRIDETIVVTGQRAEQVELAVQGRATCVHQAEQLGTAHAVMKTETVLGGKEGQTLIIVGDAVLLRSETLQAMFELHEAEQATVTILTAHVEDPRGLGRIVRNAQGNVVRIVEEKDATSEERLIREINSGIFCFDNRALFDALSRIDNNNAQGEYYLPDCVQILLNAGGKICTVSAPDAAEVYCVNDRVQLAKAQQLMQQRINESHMKSGVTIVDPANTYIDADVTIGTDTIVRPGTILEGRTSIGNDCTIGPNTHLVNVQVDDGVQVAHSVLTDSTVGPAAVVGPYSHVRPHTDIGESVRVGNFVELKNTRVGLRSKVAHLSYVGDTDVGSGVNVGCGVVTVNYDGFQKHKTILEDDSFIGSNTNLIAPVHVGKGAYVATGSTITNDVPGGAFAIARERQTTKPDYADQLRERLKKNKETKK